MQTMMSFFQSINDETILAFLGISLCVGLIVFRIYERNKSILLSDISFDDTYIQKIFRQTAATLTSLEFRKNEQPTTDQQGNYQPLFLWAIEQKEAALHALCFSNGRFTRSFCEYIQTKYRTPRRKHLSMLIAGYTVYHQYRTKHNFDEFTGAANSLSPEEFFDIKKHLTGDIVGVYIFYNVSKNLFYVGQAKKVFFRINQHFSGHGNGDIYADYKYGDQFEIKMVALSQSGYSDLDKLERDLIEQYNAHKLGYNKTIGNW